MVKILVDNMAALINAERKALGLHELYVVPYLNECSAIRAEEASINYSHTRPDGEYWSTVIDYNKFKYGYSAENLACGSSDIKTILNQWRNSSKNWAAIINANTTHMGIGVFYSPSSEYQWYWCTIFTNDINGEVEHEGQYLPKEIDLNRKISVISKDENGEILTDSTIVMSSENGTLEFVKLEKNGDSFTDFTISADKKHLAFQSDEVPVTILNIPTETYYNYSVRSSKSGYKSEKISFMMSADGTVLTGTEEINRNFVLEMKPQKLHIMFYAADYAGSTLILESSGDLSGVESAINFSLSSDCKSLSFTPIGQENIFDKLPHGSYKLYVQSVPEGYKSPDMLNFSITEETTEDVYQSISLSEISVYFYCYGTNESSQQILVSGAEFTLTHLGGKSLENVTSNNTELSIENGSVSWISGNYAVLSRLPTGDYQLIENTPPDGYSTAQEITFSIDSKGNINNLTNGIAAGTFGIKILHSKFVPNLWTLRRANVIKVYDISYPQEDFRTENNGLAVLSPVSCVSTHNADTWDVQFVHPIDEWGKWKHLLVENILKIDGQLFRIDTQEAECSENGNFITVHARHITCDMADDLIEEAIFEGGTAQNFIDFAFANGVIPWDDEHNQEHPEDYYHKPYKFDGYSDIDTFLDGCEYVNTTLWGAIAGTDNCLINRYGGELYRDNFYFSVCKRMENARDNAFFMRYSHDIAGIKQRIDYTNFCTNLNCYDNFGNMWGISYTGDARDMIHHARRRMYKFNYKDAETGEKQLSIDGEALWQTMNHPQVSYEIQFAALKRDPRYSEFEIIQNFNYGDSGTIYCPELDINTIQKITEIVKDEINGEIISMKLGNITESLVRPTFLGSTISSGHSISDRLSSRISKLETVDKEQNGGKKNG